MEKIKRLGLFDSGLGGYSVFHELKQALPDLDMVLLVDQKNAPYGNRTKKEINALAQKGMQWFLDHDIQDVLIACNTVSALSLPMLKTKFPNLNIYGIIDLTLSQVKDVNLSIVATQATVNSHAYKEAYVGNVQEVALPTLVSMIESMGDVHDYLSKSLTCIHDDHQVILACTHFPLVKDEFELILKRPVFDSIKPIIDFIKITYSPGQGLTQVFTSGSPSYFQTQIQSIFNEKEEVNLWNS